MLSWCIYFDDETTFSSLDGSWEEAPTDGVIFVVLRSGERTEFLSGADYYVRFEDDGSVAATGDIGPLLRRRPPLSADAIKFGRYTSNQRMERISRRVREEWR